MADGGRAQAQLYALLDIVTEVAFYDMFIGLCGGPCWRGLHGLSDGAHLPALLSAWLSSGHQLFALSLCFCLFLSLVLPILTSTLERQGPWV